MSDHETEGALGLDGLLAWSQARYVAREAAKPLAPRAARLDEAHGSILASSLLSPYDEPFAGRERGAVHRSRVAHRDPVELFDLESDPDESTNLWESAPNEPLERLRAHAEEATQTWVELERPEALDLPATRDRSEEP